MILENVQYLSRDASTDLRNIRYTVITMPLYTAGQQTVEKAQLVHLAGPSSAFGEIQTVCHTPLIQADFSYHINPEIFTVTTTGTGSTSVSGGSAILSTGTDSNGRVHIQSKSSIKYRAGEGRMMRFSAIFNEGVANSQQIIGIGDEDNGFFFGYNGTTFGILHRNAGIDGEGANTWIPQASWNKDKMTGIGHSKLNLDPQKGNVYEIQFQWLGYGAINFFVEDTNGRFVMVHRIKYNNNHTVPSITNPHLPICYCLKNLGNTSNVAMKSSSIAIYTEGLDVVTGPTRPINASRAVNNSETHIVSVKNRTTFHSITNRLSVKVLNICAITSSAKSVMLKVLKNATTSGGSSWSNENTDSSLIQTKTNGSTSGGTEIYVFQDQMYLDLSNNNVMIYPGETISVCARKITGSGNVSVTVMMNFQEDL